MKLGFPLTGTWYPPDMTEGISTRRYVVSLRKMQMTFIKYPISTFKMGGICLHLDFMRLVATILSELIWFDSKDTYSP